MQDGLHCVNNGFYVAAVNVGRTSHQSEINAAMVGWLDLGSSATQTFISFPNGAFLSLLSQSVSGLAADVEPTVLLLLHVWFFPNSAQLSSTRNFFIIYNGAFIIFNKPCAHNFVYSICGNKGCACYSRAVLRQWAQPSCLCLVLCSQMWILCSQCNCLLLGFNVQVQLRLAQCRKSLLGQEVKQRGKETSLYKLLELLL